MCCGYSKEQSQWHGSFEHQKPTFKPMDKNIYTLLRQYFVFIWTYGFVHYILFVRNDSHFSSSLKELTV